MHAFLIVGKTPQERTEKTNLLIQQEQISQTTTLEPETGIHPIESIRNLTRQTHLKKENTQAILINNAEKLTQEAANAFLKTLEEPPLNTIFILTAPSEDSVLATIVSRCQVVNLGPQKPEISEKDYNQTQEIFEKLRRGGIGEKLSFADNQDDRKKAIEFVQKQILVAREELFKVTKRKKHKETKKLLQLIKNLVQAKKDLDENVNVKLILTDLLLNYPS